MASFKLTVKERKQADVTDAASRELPLQSVDGVGANGAQFVQSVVDQAGMSPSGPRASLTEEEPGPLSPLGS